MWGLACLRLTLSWAVKGNEILLYNNDGVIEGRVSITGLSGGSVEAVIFTISNDGAGSLVLEQGINAGPIPLAIFPS